MNGNAENRTGKRGRRKKGIDIKKGTASGSDVKMNLPDSFVLAHLYSG